MKLVNDKSKLKRDVRILRVIFLLLATGVLLSSYEYIAEGECQGTRGLYGGFIEAICEFAGPYGAFLVLLGLAFLLTYFAFSRQLKEQMAKKYT